MRRIIVAYSLGAYNGSTTVLAGDHESNEAIFARTRRQLSFRSRDVLPLEASFFRIVSDEHQGDGSS